MNSDMTGRGKWNKVTSWRGEMLDGVAAGKKGYSMCSFTDGTFDAACVFTYLNHRLQKRREIIITPSGRLQLMRFLIS